MAVVWERWRFFVNIWTTLISLCIVQYCHGATHWVVTENGRIEQEANSLFSLQKPFDLVAFIHQEQRINKITLLQNDLNEEKEILHHVNLQEQADISKTFFKTDPSCSKLNVRLHELDLTLNHVVSFSSKGINVADHIDLSHTSTNHKRKSPICNRNLPFTLLTYDHLAGVAERHNLPNTSEQALLSVMPYVTDVNDWSHRIANALQKNSSSWVLNNMAATFWRIKGNTIQAIDCLRAALYNSPREHKDMALLSLAIVLHHANYSMDSIVLLHASLETTSHLPLHHFVLGTIYASLEMFDMSKLCFEYVFAVQPDFAPALQRLQSVVCEMSYMEALDDQHRSLKKAFNKLKTVQHRHKSLRDLTLDHEHKRNLPLEQFTKQLHWLFKNHLTGNVHQIGTAQDQIPAMQQLNDKEMKNLQYKIINGIQNKNGIHSKNGNTKESFTVNIQVDRGTAKGHAQERLICKKTKKQ